MHTFTYPHAMWITLVEKEDINLKNREHYKGWFKGKKAGIDVLIM